MTKHKHADLIHAWADGAEIQYNIGKGWKDFSIGEQPNWEPDTEYRIKPTKLPEGFTPWFGGECPFEDGTLVDVVYRDGEVLYALAANDLADEYEDRDASCSFWNHENHPADIVGCRRSEPEEKQPVVRWLWAAKGMDGIWSVTKQFWLEKEANTTWVKLEWSRTEFKE